MRQPASRRPAITSLLVVVTAFTAKMKSSAQWPQARSEVTPVTAENTTPGRRTAAGTRRSATRWALPGWPAKCQWRLLEWQ